MKKSSIVKQIFISILLLVILCLALAIAFYQFLPSNKVVPTKVTAYATPQNIISEVTEDATEKEIKPQELTYYISDHDLDLHQRAKSYNPGKSDPFEEYSEEPTGENPSGNNDNNNNPSSNGNQNNTKDPNTVDNYYTASGLNKGTK